MPALTTAQLQIALAVLARNVTLPSPTTNQTGTFRGPGNQIQIPIDASAQGAYNTRLGTQLVTNADSRYLYINLNVGDVSSGG